MTGPGRSDRDHAADASVASGERAALGTLAPERTGTGQEPTSFLDTIGAPGLADIELNCSLPREVPRAAAFD